IGDLRQAEHHLTKLGLDLGELIIEPLETLRDLLHRPDERVSLRPGKLGHLLADAVLLRLELLDGASQLASQEVELDDAVDIAIAIHALPAAGGLDQLWIVADRANVEHALLLTGLALPVASPGRGGSSAPRSSRELR